MFATNLLNILRYKNLSQKELSINTRISESTISRLIGGSTVPNYNHIKFISKVLNVNPNYFFESTIDDKFSLENVSFMTNNSSHRVIVYSEDTDVLGVLIHIIKDAYVCCFDKVRVDQLDLIVYRVRDGSIIQNDNGEKTTFGPMENIALRMKERYESEDFNLIAKAGTIFTMGYYGGGTYVYNSIMDNYININNEGPHVKVKASPFKSVSE